MEQIIDIENNVKTDECCSICREELGLNGCLPLYKTINIFSKTTTEHFCRHHIHSTHEIKKCPICMMPISSYIYLGRDNS